MEKQLGWACKLGGVEPLWISRVGHTVLGRLIGSQIWHQPIYMALALLRGGLSKGTMASAHPDARHFSVYTFSVCTTGALQAATLVLEPRGSESE